MENIKAMMEFTEVLKNEPDKAYDFFTVNAYRFEKTDLENILKEILCSLNYHINNNFYGKLLGDILGDVQIELDENYFKIADERIKDAKFRKLSGANQRYT